MEIDNIKKDQHVNVKIARETPKQVKHTKETQSFFDKQSTRALRAREKDPNDLPKERLLQDNNRWQDRPEMESGWPKGSELLWLFVLYFCWYFLQKMFGR